MNPYIEFYYYEKLKRVNEAQLRRERLQREREEERLKALQDPRRSARIVSKYGGATGEKDSYGRLKYDPRQAAVRMRSCSDIKEEAFRRNREYWRNRYDVKARQMEEEEQAARNAGDTNRNARTASGLSKPGARFASASSEAAIRMSRPASIATVMPSTSARRRRSEERDRPSASGERGRPRSRQQSQQIQPKAKPTNPKPPTKPVQESSEPAASKANPPPSLIKPKPRPESRVQVDWNHVKKLTEQRKKIGGGEGRADSDSDVVIITDVEDNDDSRDSDFIPGSERRRVRGKDKRTKKASTSSSSSRPVRRRSTRRHCSSSSGRSINVDLGRSSHASEAEEIARARRGFYTAVVKVERLCLKNLNIKKKL